MNRIKRTIGYVTLTTTVLAGALAVSASTMADPAAPDHVSIASPLLTQSVGEYEARWAVEDGRVSQSFEEAGTLVSTGSSAFQEDVAADSVISFGYVAGFDSDATGESYAQLSGQAGPDVTGVRVENGSGVVTTAALVDGIWGAVWLAGDGDSDHGAATIEFDTAAGTHSVSTDDVDVIAANRD